MKRRYTGTLFHPDLPLSEIEITIYERTKYERQVNPPKEIIYKGITAWSVIEGGEEAEEIERELDAKAADEFHEYLVLELLDGSRATFRNSHVSMFVY